MNSPASQRPIGFSPGEISQLINESVIAQHAEESAFLWTLRDQAVEAPNYRLVDLQRLEERVEAHLEGLRVAGRFGRDLSEQFLEKGEAGETFAAALLGFDSNDSALIQRVLSVALVQHLARGIVSALGWLPFKRVESKIRDFLDSENPAIRRIGIAASASHRVDPGLPLRDAIVATDPFLRARGLRAVGELGRVELVPKLRSGFADPNQNVRFAAAWSTTRMSENLDSLALLRTIGESNSPYAAEALDIAIRRMDIAGAKIWQASLANTGKLRAAVVAAGAIGDPSLLPWVIRQMDFPQLARVAGQAFTMITGADLAFEDLDQDKPEGFEAEASANAEGEEIGRDPDLHLRWPLPKLVTEWWDKNQGRFRSGRRYLRGKEIIPGALRDVLLNGMQRERAAAALELALHDTTKPLFNVRARARVQLEELKTWSW